jgi:nitrite reductase (NADH) large subunit
MISKGPYHCYHKYALTDYLCGRLKKESLFDEYISRYVDDNITVRLSQPVTHIDTKNKQVYLSHREKVPYDKLLIATGVRPYIPAVYKHYSPVFTPFNNLDDTISLRSRKDTLKKTLVLAGGLTSIKLARALKTMGNVVDFLLYKKKTATLLADEAAIDTIKDVLLKEKITIFEDINIRRISTGKNGYTVTFSNGKKKFYSTILATFGVQPHIELSKKSGIKCERGVLVNEYFETNIRDVYAAGDIAQIYNPTIHDYWVNFGWPNAVIQGTLAAKNMCGVKEAYDTDRVNIFDIRGIKIKYRKWE